MDWKKNREALLNEKGCVHGLYEYATILDEAFTNGAQLEYRGRTQWYTTRISDHVRSEDGGTAYRVNPSWLDAKIAEQEAAEAKAKGCAWVDYQVTFDDGVEAMASGYYLAHAERHPLFAGFVSDDGAVYATWGDWVDGMADTEFGEGDGPAEVGYRIPTPKAVRMWKESK